MSQVVKPELTLRGYSKRKPFELWSAKRLFCRQDYNRGFMLRLKPLVLDRRRTLYGVTQENSIENSVQDCLPYIQIPNGPCELFLAYPKWSYVHFEVNMCFPHCITSFFQNLLHSSMYRKTLWPCHLMWSAMWQCDLVPLTLTLVLRIE